MSLLLWYVVAIGVAVADSEAGFVVESVVVVVAGFVDGVAVVGAVGIGAEAVGVSELAAVVAVAGLSAGPAVADLVVQDWFV